MSALRQKYLQKCDDFTCAPIPALLSVLDEAVAQGGDAPLDLKLNGNSKLLFKSRVQPMQVFALCEAVGDAPVVALDLSLNHVDDLAAQALAGLVKANPHLRYLNLAGNDIGAAGAEHLARALSASSCQLQVLSLGGNALGDKGILALGTALRVNTSLQALDLSETGAGIKGLVTLCGALGSEGPPANTTLKALDIGGPLIHTQQDTVILALARMLAGNSSIQELGLSKMRLTDHQLDTLAQYGLLRSASICSLDLRANRLSGFAGPTLERVITECRQLLSVNLEANSLGDAGAHALAGCLPYCPWLTRLNLRSNSIGEQGLRSIASALLSAPHLRLLLLWGNAIGPGASRALQDALRDLPQGLAAESGGPGLVTDVRSYEVDGVAQVALVEVDGQILVEEEGQGDEEGDEVELGLEE